MRYGFPAFALLLLAGCVGSGPAATESDHYQGRTPRFVVDVYISHTAETDGRDCRVEIRSRPGMQLTPAPLYAYGIDEGCDNLFGTGTDFERIYIRPGGPAISRGEVRLQLREAFRVVVPPLVQMP